MNIQDKNIILTIIKELDSKNNKNIEITELIKKYPKTKGGFFTKSQILAVYRNNKDEFKIKEKEILKFLKLKPIRTMSGVATVTVLTKPYPCPGNCIFCPNDIRMPKSYLPNEPGAQRAENNYFDPYLQVINRLTNLLQMGHNLNKIELIILGGTWTAYKEEYQIFFITKIFEALNDFSIESKEFIEKKVKNIERIYQDSINKLKKSNLPYLTKNPQENSKFLDSWQQEILKNKNNYNKLINQIYIKNDEVSGINNYQKNTLVQLIKQQKINEITKCRNVGLVIETRPDEINKNVLIFLRKLGITKIQVGIQSLNDEVLEKNQRFTKRTQIANAFQLMRNFGFKIHIHFMANLYGSNPNMDVDDYNTLFRDENFRPDEVKLYPCSLIETAQLMNYYLEGKWQPYSDEELLYVLRQNLLNTPEYCRITRMIRDISSNDIVVGNKKTNFRQIVENSLKEDELEIKEIRSSEIRNRKFNSEFIKLKITKYQTADGENYFLNYRTKENYLLGFLRLFLPKNSVIKNLDNCSIIREIHVYGAVANFNEKQTSKAQHFGFGKKLIEEAKKISRLNNYKKMAVISAVGTREYYRKRGFIDGELYQYLDLK